MADSKLSDRPDLTFEFNLPHGIDIDQEASVDRVLGDTANDNSWSFDRLRDNNGLTPGVANSAAQHSNDDVDLTYRQFSPGFSDDEGSGEAFERSWPGHQAKKEAAKTAKGKKSPRRSDDESEDLETETQAKKPCQSLFGGVDREMDIDEQADNLLAPATPGLGLGNRMSSLALDQQHDGDGVEYPVSDSFGLACSDIGSVRDSPPSSDDEVIIPPGTVVSSLGLAFLTVSSDNLFTVLLRAAPEHQSPEGCHARRY